MADTIGVKNPLRYRGYYYDTETSLYYLQSRYYDPETCRFINADAYVIAGDDYIQGTNMYAYCYNNPVMYVDPSGYKVMEPYEKDTSHPAVFCACLVSAWAIMLFELGMSPYETAIFTLEVGDVGDLVYVAEIMYNGKMNGKYTDNSYIDCNSFRVCKALTNKKVCEEVAKWYDWVDDDLTEIDVAQEIYGHAMVYYNLETVKPYIDNAIRRLDEDWSTLDEHAVQINIGGDRPEDALIDLVCNVIWYIPT